MNKNRPVIMLLLLKVLSGIVLSQESEISKSCKFDRPLPIEGTCVASWAIAIAAAATDAWCSYYFKDTQELYRFQFSADHMIQCCEECPIYDGKSCLGSSTELGLKFMATNGLVFGPDRIDLGQIDAPNPDRCMPIYSFVKCEKPLGAGCSIPVPSSCPNKCTLDN